MEIRTNSNRRNTKYEGTERSGSAPALHTVAGKFSASLLLAVGTLFPEATAAQAAGPESPSGEIRGAVTGINVQGDATALEGQSRESQCRLSETGPVVHPKRRRWSFSIQLQLPRGFTISPVVDLHTGFRYSNVDVLNNYVGRPNSQRFPTYFSLDMKIYRDFKLPAFAGRLQDHRFRIGIYSLNVTNHLNPRDVYNKVASFVFGHFVGFNTGSTAC